MKVLGLVVSDKKVFENCFLKTFFVLLTYLCNQSEPFVVWDHPGTIPVQFVTFPLAVQDKKLFEVFII